MEQCILIIEDNPDITRVVSYELEQAGYKVLSAADGVSGLTQAREHNPDLVILDLGLPDFDGAEIARRLRKTSSVPIIILTAMDAIDRKVNLLEAGADDYLTKPFSAAELAARVRALLRRSGSDRAKGLVRVGALELNLDAGSAMFAGRDLHLTRREFDLLAFMAAHPGRVYSRQDLLDKVWGVDFIGGERTVDQHVTQLRAHLDDDPTSPAYLETVRGKGYRMRAQE